MAKSEEGIIRNERVAMMMVARDVLGMMFHRHYGSDPGGMPVATPERELSKEEQGVYTSAIKYLTKEFNIGHRELPMEHAKEKPEDPPGEKSKEPKPV